MNQSVPPSLVQADVLPISRRVRYFFETAGFFLVIGFFQLFDIDTASAIGGWIGRNLAMATPASRRAIANLSAAYPEKNEGEIAALARGMWDNLGRVMAEYAHLDKIHLTGADPRIELIGMENIEAAKASGKGVIFASGHFANWEIMPFAARDLGFDGGMVVRPASNPYVHRWLDRVRSRNGVPVQIPKGAQGTRRAFALLRKGEALLLLIDQRASEGILVPFFGRDAFTTPAPAALALKLGAVILPVSNERVDGARFRVRVYPPIQPASTGDSDRDLMALTTQLTQFIETRVRERPCEWLWIHRRWVSEDAPKRKRAQALSPGRAETTSPTSKRV
jgi:KDO2-lipid IV(A) lauroyltransferase